MKKEITIIPATRDKFTSLPTNNFSKRRVAAYARVSTDSDEQFTSYEAQIDYYTNYIMSRPEWEFVKVYTDEGISGTNTKHRDGFNEMIDDALAGKIDLIITKSVSRFARNTVDSLVTVRKLKENHVEVFFEKENIYTFDSKGELLITIMSSLAQEESRSISENVTWGQRKRFADGKVSLPYKSFLGYDRGKNGEPVINEEEAKIVRLIYKMYLEGYSIPGICKHLDSNGIPTPRKRGKWSTTTIGSILKNEKYKGDALLQKCYTVDFLTKKQKVNTGEVPQYYVENSHEAIIDRLDFDRVQAEIQRRKNLGKGFKANSIFACKLICEDCGSFYGQKTWHSNDVYRRLVWQCNNKFKSSCNTPYYDIEDIKRMYLTACQTLLSTKTETIRACEEMHAIVCDYTSIDNEISQLSEEMGIIAEMVEQCVNENANKIQSQEAYEKKYNKLVERYRRIEKKVMKLKEKRMEILEKDNKLRNFIKSLKEQPETITEWDDSLWRDLLDTAVVHKDKSITFRFKDGTEVSVNF